MKKQKKAYLVLADGTVFEGIGFGANQMRSGEVVFNTALTGYQEIITDPSYKGQIVVMTYPHIGNYGVTADDKESRSLFLSGLVVREISPVVSNYRSQQSLPDYLKENDVPGISEIDTRALVRHIREKGAMQAILAVGDQHQIADLKKRAKKLPSLEGQNLAAVVSSTKPYEYKKGLKDFVKTQPISRLTPKRKYHVVAYDFGIKENILRLLVEHGCHVKVVPYDYSAEDILKLPHPVDGVFLSNGPGDPAVCDLAIQNTQKLLGKKPIFGICLGHQILALALGAQTSKLKFGHHGGNHPVMDLATRRVEITSQNHGFVVEEKNLPNHIEVTHVNLNDQTVEGIRHKTLPAFSVQYHPESAPGPHDSRYLFERFISMMDNFKH